MRKLQVLFGLAIVGLVSSSVLAAPVAFKPSDAQDVPGALVMSYDPGDGHLWVSGNGLNISTLEIKSTGSKFIPGGIPAGTISPPFDVATAAKIFKLSTGGFPSLDLGLAYPAGTAKDAILADLAVDGSKLPSGNLQVAGGPFLYYVPEPSSLALIFCGLLGMLKIRRK